MDQEYTLFGKSAGRMTSPVKQDSLRIRERGLLKINDVFGPPITVTNEIILKWLRVYRSITLPTESFEQWFTNWLANELASAGYVRISNNQAFTRFANGEWAKEYKIVPTC